MNLERSGPIFFSEPIIHVPFHYPAQSITSGFSSFVPKLNNSLPTEIALRLGFSPSFASETLKLDCFGGFFKSRGMGKKKPKDQTDVKMETTGHSGSTSIFKTLFGDVKEGSASASIFSENNPFRRMTGPSASGPVDSVAVSENLENGGSDNPDVGQLMKEKRHKTKKLEAAANKENNNSGGSSPEFSRLSKTGKDKTSEPDSEIKETSRDGRVSNPDSGLKSDSTSENAMEDVRVLEVGKRDGVADGNLKRRKKRKRDDIELEYEAKKYGAAGTNEGGEEGLKGKAVGQKRKVLDDPADMLVSKESFDDETKLLRTVFVGNLPLKLKKKALIKEFSQFGEVESVRIRSVPIMDSKKPRKGAIMSNEINESVDSVNAYVVFKTEESAKASLSHNMAVVAGNHIRVDRACPPRKKLKGDNGPVYDHKRTIFVGSLPFDVKDEEVYKCFCGINNIGSSVEGVRVIRDPHLNVGKGFAYVLFKTREAANLAAKKRNVKLRDRELRLFHAKPNMTPSKRANPSPSQGGSPAKKLAVDSGTPDKKRKAIAKSPASYQGLRASKHGSEKKKHVKKSVSRMLKPEKTSGGETPTERKRKRPAVAARKAKAKAMKSGGMPKQAGFKRKFSSRTPESSHRNKKARR